MTFKRCVVNLMLLIQLSNGFAQNLVGTNLRLKPSTLPLTCNDGDIRFDTAVSRTKYCSTNLWTQFADLNSTVAFASAAGTANTCGTAAFAGTASFVTSASLAGLADIAKLSTAFATNPADCSAGQFATTIAANGDLTCTTPANTFGPTFTVTDTNADSPLIKEMVKIRRTGGSGTVGTPTRAGAITFQDQDNPTYVAMISGVRKNPQTDYDGQLKFYVNNSGGQVTDHNNLGLVLTLDQGSNANFAGNVTATSFIGTVSTASRAGTAAATESFSGVLAVANGGTNNGTLAVTNGGIIYGDGSKLMNSGAGTAGQTFKSTGAGVPVWRNSYPTISRLTASGTFTPAATTSWMRLQMVGGGMGGASGGSASSALGGNGTPTAFGGWTAASNTGSNSTGCMISQASAPGGRGGGQHNNSGGNGASSVLGPGGAGGTNGGGTGTAAQVNTGGGGGGGGGNAGDLNQAGPGGDSGSYCETIITAVSATYSYSIGGGGTAAAAGAGGGAGSTGGSGIIYVWEW